MKGGDRLLGPRHVTSNMLGPNSYVKHLSSSVNIYFTTIVELKEEEEEKITALLDYVPKA